MSQEWYRLVGSYDRLRRTLLDLPNDGRLDKPLSFWVLPADRRLPIAFLDRPLRELIETPLDELMTTPGVGKKKILGFFDLMRRAAKDEDTDQLFGLGSPPTSTLESTADTSSTFNPSVVSEALWETWCETVRRNDLGDQKLGYLAPTLRNLPTVIWHTPLSEYVESTLDEIRHRRTHGTKRVNAIMEVFCIAHEALSTAALHEDLNLELMPRFVPRLTRWLNAAIRSPDLPPFAEIQQFLVRPLIGQIKVDLDDPVAQLAEERLRFDAESPSVKQQAELMGVTRARVYQLLEDCGHVMDVRWPEGRWLLLPLARKFGNGDAATIGLLNGVRDLFYPDERAMSSASESSQAFAEDD